MKVAKSPWKRAIRFSFALCGALALAGLTGCGNRKAGEELAKAGIAAADTLATYYDSLVQDTVDIWEMEAFLASIRGVSFDEKAQEALQDQIEALQHRARLARTLAGTYSALKSLSSYDASGEVKGAAAKLAEEVKAIPVLSKSNVNPSDIIGSLAGDIAAWQQSKDIRKGAKLISDTLGKLKQLYDKEIGAYKSIASERGNKVTGVITHLLDNKLLVGVPLPQKALESLGLAWAPQKKWIEDDKTIKAVIEVAKARTQRIAFLSSDAADSVAMSISLLIRNHDDFQNKKGLTPSEILAAIQKAQSYIDEISRLRKESNKE